MKKKDQSNRNSRIFYKVLLNIWLIITVMLVLVAIVTFPVQRKNAISSLKSQASDIAQSVSQVISTALLSEDYSFVIDHCLSVVSRSRAIEYVIISKPDDTLFKPIIILKDKWQFISLPDEFNHPDKELLNGKILKSNLFDKEIFHYPIKIEYNKLDWGFVQIGMSVVPFNELQNITVRNTILLILAFLILGFIASAVFAKKLTYPITELNDLTRELAHGNLNVRSSIKAKDELGQLADSFNKMADQIQDYYRTLEENVNQRTGELLNEIQVRKRAEEQVNNINQRLEIIVNERTIELNNALSELKAEIAIRINAQEELERSQFEIQETLKTQIELNKLKSTFISSVSHQFRTPLTIILSSCELMMLLSRNDQDRSIERHFIRIKDSIIFLTNMLDDILFIGRLDSHMVDLYIKKSDVISLAKSIAEQLRTSVNSKVAVEIQSEFSKIIALIDADLYMKIISNIISNSIKFSYDNSKVNISISIVNDELIFVVQDKGIGISEKDIRHIFEPFYRADNAMKIKGAGLGLTIVKSAAQIMDCKIDIRSELNVGTTVQLSFPVIIEELDKL